ncbi:MAG: carbohydrate porin [Thermodesulfobacteriota bacterium]
MSRHLLIILLFFIVISLQLAEDVQSKESSKTDKWLEGKYMTGNWRGHRDKLNEQGYMPFANYHVSVLGNPSGGESNGVEYAGQLIAGVEFDLEKIVKINGLSFIVSGTWISGNSLSFEHIGNIFSVSDVFNLPVGFTFSIDSFRLYQLMFVQELMDNKINVAFGRLAIGNDFATIDILNDFTNTAFNANPGSIKFNVPTFTVDPFANWGARVLYKPDERFYYMAGIYSANPDIADLDNNGLDFSFDGGAFLITEISYSPNLNKSDNGLPGVYKLGAYLDSTDIPELSDPASEASNNYGFYALFQQMVYREKNSDEQGLTIFSTVAYAPKEEVNQFPFFYSGGIGYKGLLHSRTKDTTVLGFLAGVFSDDLPGQDYEMIVELSYNIMVAEWMAVQPDLQYVINPNGTDEIDNAIVLGVRMEVEF